MIEQGPEVNCGTGHTIPVPAQCAGERHLPLVASAAAKQQARLDGLISRIANAPPEVLLVGDVLDREYGRAGMRVYDERRISVPGTIAVSNCLNDDAPSN